MKGSTMRNFYVCTNLKINLGVKESIEYSKKVVDFVNKNVPKNSNVEVFFFPDFLPLYPILEITNQSKVNIGAQNCFWEETGAFTGEVSIKSLKEIGCKYVMVGHPERLLYFKEDLEMVNKKIHIIIKNGLIPLVFIVEKEKENNIHIASSKLKKQIIPLLNGVAKDDLKKIILFYEPAWTIGTLSAVPVDHINHIILQLREMLNSIYGNSVGDQQVFFYGGGVTLKSAKDIIDSESINGIGMGKAALDFSFFSSLINLAVKLKDNI
jgi:triosephosphate isomerase